MSSEQYCDTSSHKLRYLLFVRFEYHSSGHNHGRWTVGGCISMAPQARPLIIGISGASSSGKTTLARLLRDVWPDTLILHEDDFYWTDDKIPVRNGLQDWDCMEALDLTRLETTLDYLSAHGSLPPELESKEDKNSVGESGVDRTVVVKWRDRARQFVSSRQTRPIAIVDGFLLYSPQMESIWQLFDVKLFLRTKYVV